MSDKEESGNWKTIVYTIVDTYILEHLIQWYIDMIYKPKMRMSVWCKALTLQSSAHPLNTMHTSSVLSQAVKTLQNVLGVIWEWFQEDAGASW